MAKRVMELIVLAGLLTAVASAETHWNLQAVYPSGYTSNSYPGTLTRITIEGIILNRPENMVNTKDEWQIYIQSDGVNDHGGTAVYMRKDNFSEDQIYSDANWASELYRIENNTNGYVFSPGDKVRVNGLTMFYRGKVNINEQHTLNEANDFTIELLEPAVGLPKPDVITISHVKNINDDFVFDANRANGGCEYYQGTLVRINNLEVVDSNWQPGGELVVADGTGRTFDIELGRGSGFLQYSMPTGNIDIIGIFDQEAPGTYPNFDLKAGYRLWVMNYDGNGSVLADEYVKRGYLASDVNIDGAVDFRDFSIMAANWLKCSDVDECE